MLMRVCRITGLISAILFGLLLLNSFGCNYEMTLQSSEANYYGVCHGGKVTILEQDLSGNSQWRISGFQLPIGQQVFLWVTRREPIRQVDGGNSSLDNYNQTQINRFVLVNFGWLMLSPTQIALFEHSPHPEISVGKFHGWMDFYHRLLPLTPLTATAVR